MLLRPLYDVLRMISICADCTREKKKALVGTKQWFLGSKVSDSGYISHTAATLYSVGFLVLLYSVAWRPVKPTLQITYHFSNWV